MTDTWFEYVGRVTRNAGPGEIEERTEISSATVSRWNPKNKGGGARPEADTVVQFARRYDRSPLEALIHAGYIEAEDVGRPIEFVSSMHDVSNEAFMDELERRLGRLSELEAGDDAEDGLIGDDFIENPGMDGIQDRDQG